MRYSQAFIPTLKEDPAEAEVVSHRLMMRAGCIRKLTAGVYTYLPYGLAAIRRVEQIVREEMNRAGAIELMMPMVQPADLWKESGRYIKYGPELLRFTDRHDRESCLGPTHEEVITDLIRKELHSYRDLPVNLYQIQTKFRDEIRPRFGLMRGREFLMKDAYSFDADDAGAEASYWKMYEAYKRIFNRCGLRFRAVQADSGAIGGNFSHEFMVLAKTGEDTVVACSACDYAANVEKAAIAALAPVQPTTATSEKIETPGKKKVADVCAFLGIKASELVKTMVYLADGKPVAILVRGDREVEPVKVKNMIKAVDIVAASDDEAFAVTRMPPGYLGPVGLNIPIYADQEVMAMGECVVGAGEKNFHLRHVAPGRDFRVEAARVGDLRRVTTSDRCPLCGGAFEMTEGIEVGHVFKLGTGYSEAMGATFQDQDGQERPFVMGCYGIGVSRVVAACIEQNHDEHGIIFPLPLAPYQVMIVNLGINDEKITACAEKLYAELQRAGIDVLLDDRDERPGAKFKDADLLGMPFRLTVGKTFLTKGLVELRERHSSASEEVAPENVAALLRGRIDAAMPEH
ncbi:MAG: proline--tRNA ligase [Desulfobulbaceae bacterium]|jgi:prolyl-tRNA synthetase|nr:proline--tRNA ligase [Desulfobulbaceae bacterium]